LVDNLNLAAPASITVKADVTTPITGVKVVDSVEGLTFNLTLSDSVGELSLVMNGATISVGAGASLTYDNLTLSQINAALATLSYENTTGGTDSINLTVSDSAGSTITGNIGVSGAVVPEVTSISATTTGIGTTEAITGNVVTITVKLNEPVTISGTPTLQLSDNEVATFLSGSGTNTLTFDYTVQAADSTSDLKVTGLNLPSGVSIHDSAGNALTTVSGDLGLQINPAVSNPINPATFPFVNNNDLTEAIYIGYFGRAGDPSGYSYWVNQLNTGSLSETGVAASFSVQPETTGTYPFLASEVPGTLETVTSSNGWSASVPTNVYNFVNSVYEDLFSRSVLADSNDSGLVYWSNQLAANAGNAQAIATFILSVISGASGADQTTIVNKVTVADYFTQALTGISFTSSADTLAHTAIASVTSGAEVALVGTSTTSVTSSIS
jgi:hypothetical protein